jgi:hypothetical protein
LIRSSKITKTIHFEDEDEPEIDYAKLLQYRNFEMLCGEDDKADPTSSTESKTPFEILKLKMQDVSPAKDEGVIKRVLIPGYGALIQNGSHVKGKVSHFPAWTVCCRNNRKSFFSKFTIMLTLK